MSIFVSLDKLLSINRQSLFTDPLFHQIANPHFDLELQKVDQVKV